METCGSTQSKTPTIASFSSLSSPDSPTSSSSTGCDPARSLCSRAATVSLILLTILDARARPDEVELRGRSSDTDDRRGSLSCDAELSGSSPALHPGRSPPRLVDAPLESSGLPKLGGAGSTAAADGKGEVSCPSSSTPELVLVFTCPADILVAGEGEAGVPDLDDTDRLRIVTVTLCDRFRPWTGVPEAVRGQRDPTPGEATEGLAAVPGDARSPRRSPSKFGIRIGATAGRLVTPPPRGSASLLLVTDDDGPASASPDCCVAVSGTPASVSEFARRMDGIGRRFILRRKGGASDVFSSRKELLVSDVAENQEEVVTPFCPTETR